MEAGRSDWCCCHKRWGSGSRRAWSKVWLMTASVVYLSPFVALSRQLIAREQRSLLLLLSTCSARQSNRFHAFWTWEKCAALPVVSSECWCDDHLTPTVWLETKVAYLNPWAWGCCLNGTQNRQFSIKTSQRDESGTQIQFLFWQNKPIFYLHWKKIYAFMWNPAEHRLTLSSQYHHSDMGDRFRVGVFLHFAR